jgi:hypothetical protein
VHDRSGLDASAENTADESDDDDTEDGSDPFVNALLAQLEEVRGKVSPYSTYLVLIDALANSTFSGLMRKHDVPR